MLIMLGVVTLGVLSSYYFIYRDIKSKNEHISSLIQQLDFQSSRQEYLVSTQRMIENLNSDMTKINDSIVSKDGDVEFIENLENRAKNKGLTINIESLNVEDDPTSTASSITKLKLSAKTKGSWDGTYTFLSELESLPFKIKIEKFSIVNESRSEVLDGKQTYTYSPDWKTSFEIVVLKYK